MSESQERSAFIASLQKDKAMLAKTASKKVGGTFLDDSDLISTLGLSETRRLFKTRLSRVNYGIDKNGDNYFSFSFVVIEGKNKGIPIGVDYIGLPKADKVKKEKNYEKLMGMFQRLGMDTTKWAAKDIPENCLDAADQLTAEGTGVTLALNVWGTDKDRVGSNVVSIFPVDETSSESTPEASEEEETEEEEVEEEEEETEVAGPEDGSTWEEWVGYEATLSDEDGNETAVTTTAYDDGVFTCEDAEGVEYECSPEDLTF